MPYRSDTLTLAGNPGMETGRWLMLMQTTGGKVVAVLSPALAGKLRLYHQQELTEALLRQKPQYRCQLDNVTSVAAVRAAELTLFGK